MTKTEVIVDIQQNKDEGKNLTSVNGWMITGKMEKKSGEAEHFFVKKGEQKGVLKLYRKKKEDWWISIIKDIKEENAGTIVSIYDTGTFDSRTYVIMKHYESGTLADRILTVRKDDLKSFIKDIDDALMYLHAQGITHGDLKPSNIFIYNDRFLLGDLGSIQMKDKNVSVGFTPGYAAPDFLFSKNNLNSSYDYFSFGCCIVFFITQKNCYKDRLKEHILLDALNGVVADDFLSRPELSDLEYDLKKLLRGLLCNNAEKRFGHKHIQAYLDGTSFSSDEAEYIYELPGCGFSINNKSSLLQAFDLWPEVIAELLLSETPSFFLALAKFASERISNEVHKVIINMKKESSHKYIRWQFDLELSSNLVFVTRKMIDK